MKTVSGADMELFEEYKTMKCLGTDRLTGKGWRYGERGGGGWVGVLSALSQRLEAVKRTGPTRRHAQLSWRDWPGRCYLCCDR
jgi:hypothetical protein